MAPVTIMCLLAATVAIVSSQQLNIPTVKPRTCTGIDVSSDLAKCGDIGTTNCSLLLETYNCLQEVSYKAEDQSCDLTVPPYDAIEQRTEAAEQNLNDQCIEPGCDQDEFGIADGIYEAQNAAVTATGTDKCKRYNEILAIKSPCKFFKEQFDVQVREELKKNKCAANKPGTSDKKEGSGAMSRAAAAPMLVASLLLASML